MLRAWSWFGNIIILRIIQVIGSTVAGAAQGDTITYISWPCAELQSLYQNTTQFYTTYPACTPDAIAKFSNHGYVAVRANFSLPTGANKGAALNAMFGAALWLALAIHVLGAELYLHLTLREAERLRQFSYTRQLERGTKCPGSAGLTVDHLGDTEPWYPKEGQTASYAKMTERRPQAPYDRMNVM